ncbi:hypothetical protein [Curtobacterium sp. MCSS17_016]|uniref:hypothetical protein n=1 Tax=Curtobacterium sp. MCSS17_016 TaxID=2175644 RepID=UPI000DA8A6CA|nr:hypothetical protein [Curtobacterium sp. MCSS17_016]WIE81289.1 hypothetical protein DEJ19_018825 [Curtobacterium sp. MCSS17_016]
MRAEFEPELPSFAITEWRTLLGKYRHLVAGLEAGIAPPDPGVLAYFHDGEPVYLTAVENLRERITADLDRTGDLTRSHTRQLVARQHLGLQHIVRGQPGHSDGDALTAVNDYLDTSGVAWIRSSSVTAARELTLLLLLAHKPPLNHDN